MQNMHMCTVQHLKSSSKNERLVLADRCNHSLYMTLSQKAKILERNNMVAVLCIWQHIPSWLTHWTLKTRVKAKVWTVLVIVILQTVLGEPGHNLTSTTGKHQCWKQWQSVGGEETGFMTPFVRWSKWKNEWSSWDNCQVLLLSDIIHNLAPIVSYESSDVTRRYLSTITFHPDVREQLWCIWLWALLHKAHRYPTHYSILQWWCWVRVVIWCSFKKVSRTISKPA
jgi:hypothetical protein